MAKLTFVLFVTLIVSFELLDTVKTEEDKDHDRAGEAEDRASYAHASVSIRPGLPYRPGPLGLHRPTPPSPSSKQGLIQCYSCVDCPEVFPNTSTKWCPRVLDPTKHSSCVTYAEQYKHLKKAWYIRGCASERGSCSDIKQAHSSHMDVVTLVSCSECEGNKCNGATRSLTDLTMAVVVLLVTPLVARATIS